MTSTVIENLPLSTRFNTGLFTSATRAVPTGFVSVVLLLTPTPFASVTHPFNSATQSITVREIAKRRGVPIFLRGQQYRQFTDAEIQEMGAMWESGVPVTSIAARIGTGHDSVGEVLRGAGFHPHARRPSGDRHAFWKGGRCMVDGGYMVIKVDPTDHLAVAMAKRNRYVLEHRLIMARALGRPLSEKETVHHINNDPTDNRLENLQLRQGRHGRGTVLMCADCGSHNLIARPLAEVTEA